MIQTTGNTLAGRMIETLRSRTFWNTGWSAAGSVTNGVIGAVSSAILARYLGVEDFGTYVLIIALLNLVTDLSDLGLNSAVVKFGAQSAKDAQPGAFRRIASTVLRMKIVLGCLVVGTAFVFLKPIIQLLFDHVDDSVGSLFQLSLLAALLLIPATFYPALMQAYQSFRKYSLAMVTRYGSKLLLLVACIPFFLPLSLELVVWVEIGSVVCFLIAGIILSPLRGFSIGQRDPGLEKQVMGFGKWIVLYQIISLLGGKVDVFFVGGISDASALGLYGAAMKIAGVVSVATYSYFTALIPEFSTVTSANALIERRRASFPIVIIMVVGIAVLAMIASPVMSLLFGDQYASSATLLQVVCIGLALNVLGHPFSAILFAQNKPAVFPVSSVISMLVFAGANFWLIPILGVMGAAVAFVLHSVALLAVILVFYFSWKKRVLPIL